MKTVLPEALRLGEYIRPGNRVVVGHSTAEPATLLEAMVSHRADYPGASLLLHAGFSTIVQPDHSDHLRLLGLGAVGTRASLAAAGILDIIPIHLSDFVRQVAGGDVEIDVALLSVSPPDAQGRYSLGLVGDYHWAVARRARVVIAEVNTQMPFTLGGPFLTADDIDICVPTDRALIEVASGSIGDTERAIAACVAGYIRDGAVLQFGVGAVPDAIAATLANFRNLGIHSGVIPMAVKTLIEHGIVNNERKGIDTGVTITGAIWGDSDFYRFAHRNPVLHVRPSTYTHALDTLARIDGFVSVNSAIEIDLSGQANLEMAGGRYVGAVGGAVDFVRGARLATKGRSILALPSTAAKGAVSRIVHNLNGPVTIARSDIDTVVTEYGSAELRGQSLSVRARRLIAIAHPDFRESLERSLTISTT